MIEIPPVWMAFGTGIMLGGMAGVVIMCLLAIGRDDKKRKEDESEFAVSEKRCRACLHATKNPFGEPCVSCLSKGYYSNWQRL